MAGVIRVLMVCTGNICRSPTAEGVLRHLVQQAGLDGRIEVDSAGTTGYHLGAPPDRRAQDHALRRGIDLSDQRAREVEVADFAAYDWILAMDRSHLKRLRQLCPPAQAGRVRLLLDFADPAKVDEHEVPDPYYGSDEGFERALDLVQLGCEGLLAALVQGLPRKPVN
jgi:protein-tyrosine phosphatase